MRSVKEGRSRRHQFGNQGSGRATCAQKGEKEESNWGRGDGSCGKTQWKNPPPPTPNAEMLVRFSSWTESGTPISTEWDESAEGMRYADCRWLEFTSIKV